MTLDPKQYIQKFGGKGAGLIWLVQNTDIGYNVPEFEIIDTSYYEDFLKQPGLARIAALLRNKANPGENHVGTYMPGCPKRLEDRCRELAEKFKGMAVVVRSSAVVSEDNEKLSGAGIYDTYFLKKNKLSEKTLADAVLKVYQSVESPRAVQYRKSNGLGEERMAVVVQRLSNAEGFVNGVVQSRLHAIANIIPITWSEEIGAVARGKGQDINTAYFRKRGSGKDIYYRLSFLSNDVRYLIGEKAGKLLTPIIIGLKKHYGKDFEAEFSADFEEGVVRMLQIRPLTNVTDKKIKFPKKKPIFTTGKVGYCMGAGEYIGPWVCRDNVKKGWDEPEHYALITPDLPQTMEKDRVLSELLEKYGGKSHFDYHLHTPNKKAIVVTGDMHPGSHALTIANENGILCLSRGVSIQRIPLLKRLEKTGPYIHIVSDGINGRVYAATEEEAREFYRRQSHEAELPVKNMMKEGNK